MTTYGPRRRRRRALLGALLALLLTVAAFAAPRPLRGDKEREYLSTDGWPRRGQGAYVLRSGRPAASPGEEPVPIASLAKVMTAYLVLKHHPLRAGDGGRPFAVDQD